MPEDPCIWKERPEAWPVVAETPAPICPLFMAAFKLAGKPANSGATACLGERCGAWHICAGSRSEAMADTEFMTQLYKPAAKETP